MEFNQVTSAEDYRAKEIYNAYCSAFPEDERRCEKQFRELFNQNHVKIFSVLEGLDDIGYFICWELSHFVFVEHFEIFSEFRSKKYGSEVLKKLYSDYSKIVLESEPEHLDETAKKRLEFYSKNGFTTIDDNYLQPPYQNGKNPVSLWLLSNFQPENTDRIREEIYDTVYCKM